MSKSPVGGSLKIRVVFDSQYISVSPGSAVIVKLFPDMATKVTYGVVSPNAISSSAPDII